MIDRMNESVVTANIRKSYRGLPSRVNSIVEIWLGRLLIKSFVLLYTTLVLIGLVLGLSLSGPVNASPGNGFLPANQVQIGYLLNYPFAKLDDLPNFGYLLKGISPNYLRMVGIGSPVDFLAEVTAFSSTRTPDGEELFIENFSRSKNRALIRLRNEIGLPSPVGGAIVRIYPSKTTMPAPIAASFTGDIQGITRWCRFIAVNAEFKSPGEIADIVSHELVHAYVASYLGFNRNALPLWFNEGLAVYLSGAPDQYFYQNGFWLRTSGISGDYQQYHFVFRFLESKLGRNGLNTFIRQSIQTQNVYELLNQKLGISSYGFLASQASNWQLQQQYLIVGVIGMGIALMGWFIFRAMHQKRLQLIEQTQTQINQINQEILFYEEHIAAALKTISESELSSIHPSPPLKETVNQNLERKALALIRQGRLLGKIGQSSEAGRLFEDAIQIAGWSPEVSDAAQLARDELAGLKV